ncbi:MAG: hypothetical protein A4E31_00155 [Methanomassiliicoccales archaeon PtaU1.Bin030]|nr:MAG: hypothetical protein A4E31_00155 [Methanomassiliicoccales archaeon PtaU1.Bin030]
MRSKRKGKLGLLIGALLMASGVVAAGVIVWNSSDTGGIVKANEAIQTGDVLRYDVVGQRDGAPVSGTVMITYLSVSEDRSAMAIRTEYNGEMEYWVVHALVTQLFDPYGKCIGSQWMDTSHGDRFVKRLIDYFPRTENGSGVFRNAYVGVESEIAYMINVSGPGYHMKAELTDSTVEGMYRWDKREVTVRAEWDVVGDGPTMYSLGPGAVDGGPLMLQQEGDIRITCNGNDSALFFMTEDNLNSMDHGAPFEFDAELSIPDGKGTRQGILAPGLYYVICANLNDTSFTSFEYEVDLR